MVERQITPFAGSISLFICLLVSIPSGIDAFIGPTYSCRNLPAPLPSSRHLASRLLSNKINPNNLEDDNQRRQRMDMVKRIQKSFYADSTGILKNFLTTTKFEDVPLWRVQWSELPGYQNVLNVHVAHYTHMFQTVLNSGDEERYFGHVYLQDGSENLDNPDYFLCRPQDPDRREMAAEERSVTHLGTLMKVRDHAQLPDGRLVILSQAMCKFSVLSIRQNLPYSIASEIRLEYDEELVAQFLLLALQLAEALPGNKEEKTREIAWEAARIAAHNEALHWEEFEFCNVSVNGEGAAVAAISVSPIANFDARKIPPNDFDAKAVMERFLESLVSPTTLSSESIGSLPSPPAAIIRGSNISEIKQNVLDLERQVWISVDYLVQLLGLLAPSNQIPIPTQLLGLLPNEPIEAWPAGFQLHNYASKLENSLVGTSTKTPFVRVDADCPNYPDLRRAQRLSFVVWVLLDTMLAGYAQTTRQSILELDSVAKRLETALRGFNAVNESLKGAVGQSAAPARGSTKSEDSGEDPESWWQ